MKTCTIDRAKLDELKRRLADAEQNLYVVRTRLEDLGERPTARNRKVRK